MSYRLYFGTALLGTVVPETRDFPSESGRFEPSDALPSRLLAYMAYSTQADVLLQSESQEYDRFTAAHESQFLDLIESDNWWLHDEAGIRHNILIPNFCQGSGIVWRWDFSK